VRFISFHPVSSVAALWSNPHSAFSPGRQRVWAPGGKAFAPRAAVHDSRKDQGGRLERFALTSGELGSAGGQTLIAALLPVLLAPHAPSTFWIGAVIASEGVFALALPYLAGALSDSAPSQWGGRFGRRGRMLVASAPIMALALVLIAALDGFWRLSAAAVLYFFALHLYMGPLRALLTDATPEEDWGKIQGVMGATHIGGVGFGLVAGGLLYSIWAPLPFLVAAALVLVLTAVTLLAARRLGETGRRVAGHGGSNREPKNAGSNGARDQAIREFRFWRELAGESRTRRFLLGNILWNAGVEGIRPYIFLFATVALGITVATASLALAGFLAAAAVGSVVVGYFGDRWGRPRVLIVGAVIAGLAMMPGLFIRDLLPLILILIPAGFGAAALISLPYAVFEGMVGDEDVGRSTGAFYMSVGMARVIAPLAVGAAIDLARGVMPETEGYPAMWPVAGVLILAGALALHLAGRADDGAT
jgi:maltose/moltooligosaccharide transporter